MQQRPKKLLEQVRDVIRLKHYAYRTEATYVQWIRRYILFHHKRHPIEMGKVEIEAFLTHLAVQGQVAASTQNQALSALLFLYREVLNMEVAGVNASRTKRPQYLPTVLTKQEAIAVIGHCDGVHQLVVKLPDKAITQSQARSLNTSRHATYSAFLPGGAIDLTPTAECGFEHRCSTPSSPILGQQL